jgi:hypothetical protein
MIDRKKLLALAASLAIACIAQAQDAVLTPAASAFLRRGPAHALAGCDLLLHRCKDVRLRVAESGNGDANDVATHWEDQTGPGLAVSVAFALPTKQWPGPPRPMIDRLRVTATRWPLLSGLRLGVNQARVLAALGEPTVRVDACWRYVDGQDDVLFCFDQERLKSVEWEFFID